MCNQLNQSINLSTRHYCYGNKYFHKLPTIRYNISLAHWRLVKFHYCTHADFYCEIKLLIIDFEGKKKFIYTYVYVLYLRVGECTPRVNV